jgi:hypothetical protein
MVSGGLVAAHLAKLFLWRGYMRKTLRLSQEHRASGTRTCPYQSTFEPHPQQKRNSLALPQTGAIYAGDNCQRDNLLIWKQTCVQQLRCSTDKAIQSVHTSATVLYGLR